MTTSWKWENGQLHLTVENDQGQVSMATVNRHELANPDFDIYQKIRELANPAGPAEPQPTEAAA